MTVIAHFKGGPAAGQSTELHEPIKEYVFAGEQFVGLADDVIVARDHIYDRAAKPRQDGSYGYSYRG